MLRILNVSFRASTVLAKFLLLIVLGRSLDQEAVGLYGLFVAYVTFGSFPLGFDFYTFSAREILRVNVSSKAWVLKNQFVFHLILYVFFIPAYIFFFEIFLPVEYLSFFFVILILEHLNQELMRILTVLSRQTFASFALFLRQGLWVYVISALAAFGVLEISLDIVLISWIVGTTTALFLSTFGVFRLGLEGWHRKVDFIWIYRGIAVAVPFFVSTLIITSLSTFDRSLVESFVGLKFLGVYVVYIGIAFGMVSLIEASVLSFKYPRLITLYSSGKFQEFNREASSMANQVVACIIFYFVAISIFHQFILGLLGGGDYLEHTIILFVLLIAVAINAASYIPHYLLYSQGHDRPIIVSHLIAFVLFFSASLVFSLVSPLYAVPTALFITYLFVLIYKYSAYKRACAHLC